jgi:hypothetical protein
MDMKNFNNGGVEVGQTVYSIRVGGRGQHELKPQVVTRVGRKYFYYKQYGHEFKISLETFKDSQYNGQFSVEVYLSLQDYEEFKEEARVFEILRRTLNIYSNGSEWSSSQMKQAMDALGIGYEQ